MGLARRSLLLAAGASVVGCSAAPSVPPLPPLEPIRLAVGGVDVVSALAAGSTSGDVAAERRQEQLRQRVQAALRSAVQPMGGNDVVRVEIVAADLRVRALPASGDVASQLGLEPTRELWSRLAADLVIVDPSGLELARAGGEVSRTSPILAGTTAPAEQDQANQLFEETIRLLIVTLRESARERLYSWLA